MDWKQAIKSQVEYLRRRKETEVEQVSTAGEAESGDEAKP